MKSYFKYLKNTIQVIVCMGLSGILASCINDPEPPSNKQTTLLIYAVATNSLTGNLVSDKNEMLQAASQIDLDKNNIIIFETQFKYLEDNTKVGNVNLLKLIKDKKSGEYSWKVIKEYNDGVASLDPSRISEIIHYVTTNYIADNYGLILWSHSTASQPYFENERAKSMAFTGNDESNSVSLPMQYSFGQDLTIANGNPFYQINIDELADAIPDNFFDYIWFDSCYMSNIETIYQFRDKCDYFVGYPTEVLDSGLPYQFVLPYLVGKYPNLIEAANSFFDFYSNSFATIAVIDTKRLEPLVDFCKTYYSNSNVTSSSLMKYSRYSTGPFYDFGDYTREMSIKTGNVFENEEWNNILGQCVLYKATTKGSLLGLNIYPERFSGISTHLYSFINEGNGLEDSTVEKYYKSLDWYKVVF